MHSTDVLINAQYLRQKAIDLTCNNFMSMARCPVLESKVVALVSSEDLCRLDQSGSTKHFAHPIKNGSDQKADEATNAKAYDAANDRADFSAITTADRPPQ